MMRIEPYFFDDDSEANDNDNLLSGLSFEEELEEELKLDDSCLADFFSEHPIDESLFLAPNPTSDAEQLFMAMPSQPSENVNSVSETDILIKHIAIVDKQIELYKKMLENNDIFLKNTESVLKKAESLLMFYQSEQQMHSKQPNLTPQKQTQAIRK